MVMLLANIAVTRPGFPVARVSSESTETKRLLGLTGGLQGFETEWNKTYGGSNSDGAESVIQTSDGGYALAGSSMSSGAGGMDFWLVKTDRYGNAAWNQTYGRPKNDLAWSVLQACDGGYALFGFTESLTTSNYDLWFIKTDSNGNAQWNKTYDRARGGICADWLGSAIKTSDGGYAVACSVGNSKALLVKIDSAGNMLFNKTYGWQYQDGALSITQTTDGGYAFSGFTKSAIWDTEDAWLVRTDAKGNTLWNKTYGKAGDDEAWSVIQTAEGGYALAGFTTSYGTGSWDAWLIKTDIAGNMLWNRTYGGAYLDWVTSIVQTEDGGYTLAGQTESFGAGQRDAWCINTDKSGNAFWNRTYGGFNNDEARVVLETKEGGYALAGSTSSIGEGQGDFWLIKLSCPPVRNLNTGLYYETIQEAINANETLNGHAIFVKAGTYCENLVINKSVSLVGENEETTIIDGNDNFNHFTLNITANDVTVTGLMVTGGAWCGGINLQNVSNTKITGDKLTGDWVGICFRSSSDNTVTESILKNNKQGIVLDSSLGNNISGNDLISNWCGIAFQVNSSSNTVSENNIIENEYGVWLERSPSNTIYHNNIINNTPQQGGYSYESTNIWDDGCPSGGNYWNDYIGVDDNGDGIGDSPYIIYANNKDNYPLIYPYETVSLLDSSSSEIFQITMEPITGSWGIPNSEYQIDVRKIVPTVDLAKDALSLFDKTKWVSPVADIVWNYVTCDTDGNGIIGGTEMECFTHANEDSLNKALAQLSVEQVFERANSLVTSEMLSKLFLLAEPGVLGVGIVLSLPYSGLTGMTSVPGVAIGGMLPNPESNPISISILTGDYQTIGTASPIELEVVTDSGLVLNRTINQIPGAKYISRDSDLDGELEDKVILPNSTQSYTFRAIPKFGADPMANYSLLIGDDWYQIPLIKDGTVQNVSSRGYGLTAYNQTSIEEMNDALLRSPDVAITNLNTTKTVVGSKLGLPITLTIKNNGNYTESLNATVYANMTYVSTIANVTVSSGDSAIVNFLWNTTGWTSGNYNITAYVWPLLGETNITNNKLSSSIIKVTIQGDINGDFYVNIKDATQVGFYWQQHAPPAPANVDINGDGVINIKDASIVGINWQKHA